MIKSNTYTLKDLESKTNLDSSQLVFVYGARKYFEEQNIHDKVKKSFPNSDIISLSTSGHFTGKKVTDNLLIQTLNFDSTHIVCKELNIEEYEGASYDLAKDLVADFDFENLKGIGIVSDETFINGTHLIDGINKVIKNTCPVFGGMAGDGFKFEKTLTSLNGEPKSGNVIAYAFYGNDLEISVNIASGWKSFGLEYTITRADKNVLYELDNQPAYDILYSLLGIQNKADFVKNMLFFPFQLSQENHKPLVRTPLFVDHDKKSITYAGDMPEGATVRIMKAGTMKLLNSVVETGQMLSKNIPEPDVIMMVSSVGRRAVMNKLVVEEALDLQECFPKHTSVIGYYSYGEFSHFSDNKAHCYLHNQTLTLTAMKEL